MRRKVQPDILKGAIRLFGLRGLNGVTTRALAREARVYEPMIYTWYKSKENLYVQAVNSVVSEINHQFTDFVLKVFGESGSPTPDQMANAVRSWYSTIPQASARLLLQVLISEDKLSSIARKPIDQMINALTKALSQVHVSTSSRKASRKFDPQASATTLVRSLLWGKVIEGKSADQDMEKTLQHWLTSVTPPT